MVIRYIFLYLFILVGFSVKGQNLVPNGSFENYSQCPDNAGQIYRAMPWFQAHIFGNDVAIGSSSDFYHQCSPNPDFQVPQNNYAGYQFAKTGNGYAGIAFFGGNDYREYIQVALNIDLQSGKKYCVSFYVSLADTSMFACDNIGLLFSTDTMKSDVILGTTLIQASPQINNTSGIISDKDNWILIAGEYTAIGGEKYITIGNFYSDINTGSMSVNGGSSPFAYYYVDDVSVVECDTVIPPQLPTESSITIPNVFTPNGDGINDVFSIESAGIESLSCEIFNRWGIKVATLSRLNEGWDGRTTSGQEATEGVYYYVLTSKGTDGKEYRKTGFIQLLR